MQLTNCPECGNAAEFLWRSVMESTDGPIEHAKVVCVQGHWFVLPVAFLATRRVERDSAPVDPRALER
jgi:hypothetical protein